MRTMAASFRFAKRARAAMNLFYMDAEIRPNRSLSERGFVVLICLVTLLNCISAGVFLAMGATLVPIFLGLDVLAIVLAFMLSFRAARRVERVQVTAGQIRVIEETPRESRVVWESPTAFTRVALEKDEDDRAIDLRLLLSGRYAPIARALSPAEREAFAKALEDAIWTARRGR
jgi:uncharacterized membrane protein